MFSSRSSYLCEDHIFYDPPNWLSLYISNINVPSITADIQWCTCVCSDNCVLVTQLCLTLCDPMDCSPPGSPVREILQTRTVEWVAISFSNAWKWKVKVKSLSRAWLLATPWTAAYRLLGPWDFPGKSTGVGCHCLLQFWWLSYSYSVLLMQPNSLTFCPFYLRNLFFPFLIKVSHIN